MNTNTKVLPELLCFNNGSPVITADDWLQRRREVYDSIVEVEYGGIPAYSGLARYECLHFCQGSTPEDSTLSTYRVIPWESKTYSFILQVIEPAGEGPFPVILCGDQCWGYVTSEVLQMIMKKKYALALFNRVELARDIYNPQRVGGIYDHYPNSQFGAISAWAWGFHRCVDILSTLSKIRSDQITVTGHSRGGKAALLAGATDERIALTAPNNSGCGGAGSFKVRGKKSECLEDMLDSIPYWFGPELANYRNRSSELPFDQHFIKALIAPRAYFSTEAIGDIWSNPSGTLKTHLAAREVFSLLNVQDRMNIYFREGGHDHGFQDWLRLCEYMDWIFQQKPRPDYLSITSLPDI